ncbi:MAG: conjugal transfer protein [Clostridia bacterium]|nr:conjugal transfer protein [Clostridia bacterium]
MEREIIKTYAGVWNTPLKIYSFQNFKLPVPIIPRDLIYFLVGAGIMFILSGFPLISKLPPVAKYGAIPFFLMKLLTKVKLDGKKPHKFFWALILYFAASKQYENFKPVKMPVKMAFDTPVVCKRSVKL